MDPLTIAISSGAGAITGALVYYLLSRNKRVPPRVETPKGKPRNDVERRVNRTEMDKARRELNAILLEKDLVSTALTRVYEAEVDGRINKQEREELTSRYKQRMKEVESKLGDAEITIEVGELEKLRSELLNLFDGKMQQIESRLIDARTKLDKMKGYSEPVVPVDDIEKVLETEEKPKPKKTKPKTEETEIDDKVKALREEVLEALARLEQMDIDG